MANCKDEIYQPTRKEQDDILDLETHSGYQDLANAIVAQAYKDLVYALLIGNADGRARTNSSRRGSEGYKSIIKWFQLDPWYATLTDVHGDFLIRKAQNEVKLINECIDSPDPIFAFNKYKYNGVMSMNLTDFKLYLENYRFDKAYPFYKAKLDSEKVTKAKKFEKLANEFFEHVLYKRDIYQKDFFASEDGAIKDLASKYKKLSVTKLKGLIKMKAKLIYHDSVY